MNIICFNNYFVYLLYIINQIKMSSNEFLDTELRDAAGFHASETEVIDMEKVERELESECNGGKTGTVNMKDCRAHLLPVRDALDLLGGKWKIPIIVALSFGNRRFRELQRHIDGITAKMLSKELKDLEMNELVKRTVFSSTPVTVEYELTEYGQTLKKVIAELRKWGSEHRKRMMR